MKAWKHIVFLGSLKHQLYSTGDYILTSWNRATINITLATAVGLTGAAYGCGCALKDMAPPVIQNYTIAGFPATEPNKWAVEGKNVDIELSTFDDKGAKDLETGSIS